MNEQTVIQNSPETVAEMEARVRKLKRRLFGRFLGLFFSLMFMGFAVATFWIDFDPKFIAFLVFVCTARLMLRD
jgi:hypothetical protein